MVKVTECGMNRQSSMSSISIIRQSLTFVIFIVPKKSSTLKFLPQRTITWPSRPADQTLMITLIYIFKKERKKERKKKKESRFMSHQKSLQILHTCQFFFFFSIMSWKWSPSFIWLYFGLLMRYEVLFPYNSTTTDGQTHARAHKHTHPFTHTHTHTPTPPHVPPGIQFSLTNATLNSPKVL